ASCAFSACGCTSPIAWSSSRICFCPARTTRGFPWPAAATPNAAVKSRYFRPSRSHTCTPLAFVQTMGQCALRSRNVTFRDSYLRSSLSISLELVGIYGHITETLQISSLEIGRLCLYSAFSMKFLTVTLGRCASELLGLAFAAGAAERVPWTTSRISGSPEPPAPFISEPAFPKLNFQAPLELVALPGTDRIVVCEHGGKIFSFRNDSGSEKAD